MLPLLPQKKSITEKNSITLMNELSSRSATSLQHDPDIHILTTERGWGQGMPDY